MIHVRSTQLRIRLLSALIAILVGCNASSTRQGAVSGHVTLDGQSVERGSILFTPIDGTPGVVTGGEIKGGQYALSGVKGPAVGWNRVEVRAARGTGKMIPRGLGGTGEPVEEQVEGVAPRFNTQSTLKVEIKAGNNTADFQVTSK